MSAEAQPWIFLSHSGAEKEFAWRLYQELVHLGYRVFFDQDACDSLPKGLPFPPRILHACRGCKMGIVVLSHDYVESLWPMLELEQLTFHNPSAPNNLYPLFFKLGPVDLSKEENLARWQAKWKEKEAAWQSRLKKAVQASFTTSEVISINIPSWLTALEKLRYQSGTVFLPHKREHDYIREIVSNICTTLPSSRRSFFLEEHVKGTERMQWVIDDLFQQAAQKSSTSTSHDRDVIVVGVWGIGGLGKTTLCKHMVNYYDREFPGRSCLLEFPTEEDEMMLLGAMKFLLLTLGRAKKEDIERISSVDQIMVQLYEGLRNQQVFLAIDNIWDWAIQRAKQTMSMVCMAGSKVLVTGRSKEMVEKLVHPWKNKIVPIPGITEEEAVAALKSFSVVLPLIPNLDEDLRSLASGLCFFECQFHPLLLKVAGAKLRHRSGGIKAEQDWKDLISRLLQEAGALPCLAHNEEKTMMKVLERSLLALTPTLQNIFVDLVICVPPAYTGYGGFVGSCKWLSMIHNGLTEMEMRDKLIELQYHGLLEITDRGIHIHDLHRMVARRRCGADRSANACFFEYSLSELSEDKCKQIKYIVSESFGSEVDTLRALMQCSKLEIFKIREFFPGGRLNDPLEDPFPLTALQIPEQNLQSLRYVELGNCGSLKRIEGWKGTPNLVSLKLFQCRSLLELGDVGCLRKLEELMMSWSRCVPDLTGCSQLKKLVFLQCNSLERLVSLGQPLNLEQLDLSNNWSLADVSTIGMFTALQHLDLSFCRALKEIRTINASNLLSLHLGGCWRLQEIGSSCALTAVEDLILSRCHNLQRIPDLKNVVRLKVLKLDGCTSALAQVRAPFVRRLSVGQALELVLGAFADLQEARDQVQLLSCMFTCTPLMLHRADDRSGAALVNLRELEIEGTKWSDHVSWLDVNGLISLERLVLASFQSVREIRGLRTLVKLKQLQISKCVLLKKIGGSDTLTTFPATLLPNIEFLRLEGCESLRELPDMTHLTKLQSIRLIGCSSLLYAPQVHSSILTYSLCKCPSLMDVSSVVALLDLKQLSLEDCSSLREIPNLTHLKSLWRIDLRGCSSLLRAPQVHSSIHTYNLCKCSSLTNVSSLESLVDLELISLEDCRSLREIPNLTHLTRLRTIDLCGCSSLLRAPQVNSSIHTYILNKCFSLMDVSSLAALLELDFLYLRHCSSLRHIPDLTHLTSLRGIDIRGCSSLLRAPQVSKRTKVYME